LILESSLKGGKRYREVWGIKRYLLVFGIPGKDFTEFLITHYPAAEGWKLLCAESRPCENILSDKMMEFTSKGYETTVITDNMMGFCLSNKKVALVFLFYQRIDKDCAYCQGGTLLTAVLAKELGIPCHLYPTEYNVRIADSGRTLCFAGDNIAPEGVKSFIPKVEKVPLSCISEKW